jgi:hypothetical protein
MIVLSGFRVSAPFASFYTLEDETLLERGPALVPAPVLTHSGTRIRDKPTVAPVS